MQKIRLRTKIEVIGMILVLTLIAVASVGSITRTISDTGDNVETFIRNSNGNYWEATDDNIQAAIDDLNGTVGGWVRLPATTIDVDRTIWVNNCSLYMYGARLNVLADVNVIVPAKRNYTTQGIQMEIAGGTIDVSYLKSHGSDFTKACIFVDNKWCWYQACLLHIHDITILGDTTGWIDYSSGTGIDVCGTSNSSGNIFGLTVSHCTIGSFQYGIRFHTGPSGDYGLNGNRFDDIYLHNCVLGIVIEGVGYIDQNLFTNIVFQGYLPWSEEAIRVDQGAYNYFQGTVFDLFEWKNQSSIINLTSGTNNNFISTNVPMSNIADNEIKTSGYLSNIETPGAVQYQNVSIVGHSGSTGSRLSVTHINPEGNFGYWGSYPRWFTSFYNKVTSGQTTYTRFYGSPTQYLDILVSDTGAAIVTRENYNGNITINPDSDVVTIDDVLKLKPRASAPSNPDEGMLYVNSNDHHIYCYLNSAWVRLD